MNHCILIQNLFLSLFENDQCYELICMSSLHDYLYNRGKKHRLIWFPWVKGTMDTQQLDIKA